jgi:hypothetical protein
MNALSDRAPVASTPSSSLWFGNAARSPSRAGIVAWQTERELSLALTKGERHEWLPGKMRVVLSHGA